MSKARSLSKLINKDTYIARFGESSVTDLAPTETDVAAEISSNPIPAFVGMIGAFSMATTTEWKTANRWLICDGSPVSRTTYSDLFTVVGTTWGTGDGSSTFNLPDLRGEFLRGFDNGQGNDPDASSRTGGDTVGSVQSNGIPRLFGSFADNHGNARHSVLNQTGHSGTMALYGSGTSSWRQGIQSSSGDYAFVNLDSSRVIPHGSDVRPRNKYVQYCIKF